ncbi:hypothetical protein [Microbulbifer sp. SSSA005]|uniref:hypothetical protein n=1 Tax=unclassified Microbulbifer TaxID=2619833 RepID=UPI00403A416D
MKATKSEETNLSDSGGDVWLFGASKFRYDSDGNVREATEGEILGQTRSSPTAMIAVLSEGSKLLLFDANGAFEQDMDAIAKLYTQDDQAPEQISEEVRAARVALRNKMRADINADVFSVYDAGKYYHNEIEVAPEKIVSEMNGLLVEHLVDKQKAFTDLKSRINAVDGWLQEQLSLKGEIEMVVMYDLHERLYFEQRKVNTLDPAYNPMPWKKSYKNNASIADWRGVGDYQTPLSKFSSETFPNNAQINLVDNLNSAFQSMIDDLHSHNSTTIKALSKSIV